MKTRRRSASQYPSVKEIDSIAELWMLRILVPLSGHKEFVMRNGFSEDKVARRLGVGDWLDNDELDFDSAAVRTQLRELHVAAEARASQLATPPVPRRLTSQVRSVATVSLTAAKCVMARRAARTSVRCSSRWWVAGGRSGRVRPQAHA